MNSAEMNKEDFEKLLGCKVSRRFYRVFKKLNLSDLDAETLGFLREQRDLEQATADEKFEELDNAKSCKKIQYLELDSVLDSYKMARSSGEEDHFIHSKIGSTTVLEFIGEKVKSIEEEIARISELKAYLEEHSAE